MPFIIKRADITQIKADIIVDTANPRPVIGAGTDSAIYKAAGAEKLLAERKKLGDIARGDFGVTPAFGLQAKYIYHTVGPVWDDGMHGETEKLSQCYKKCIENAVKTGMHSIAFPLISSGTYGFPKDIAIKTAIHAITDMVMEHPIRVYLIIFSDESLGAAKKFVPTVEEEIDGISVQALLSAEYALNSLQELSNNDPQDLQLIEQRMRNLSSAGKSPASAYSFKPAVAAGLVSENELKALLKVKERPFRELLMEHLTKTTESMASLAKKANIKRYHMSKMLNGDKPITPSKYVVMGLCVALKLGRMESLALLQSAGYGINKWHPVDLVFWTCAEFPMAESYDVEKINDLLCKNGRKEYLGTDDPNT